MFRTFSSQEKFKCIWCFQFTDVSFHDQNSKLTKSFKLIYYHSQIPRGSSATGTIQQRQRIPPAAGLYSVDQQVRLYAVLGGVLIFSVFKKGWRDHPLG